jgi:hypothetical protein
MKQSGRGIRWILPVRIRRALRQLHRRHVLRRALGEVAAASEATPAIRMSATLESLVYGWGNDTFSARHDFLAALLSYGRRAAGPILECGSGLSTVVLAKVTRQPVWSLEHDPGWRKCTQEALDTYGCSQAHVLWAPLRSYGEFAWYDPPLARMPSDFALVVCDGPPLGTPGGRYGLLPLMRSRVRPGCVVLLDDVGRPAETGVADRWVSEFKVTCTLAGDRQRFAVLTIPK